MALRRINAELTKHQKLYGLENINIGPIDDNDLFKCKAMIIGSKGSLYEDGIYLVDVIFPRDYPFKPPRLEWTHENQVDHIFHPIFSVSRRICIPVVSSAEWSPAKNIHVVLKQINDMMIALDHGHCCPCCGHLTEIEDLKDRSDATTLFIEDRQKFNETARKFNKTYAQLGATQETDLIVTGYIRQKIENVHIPTDIVTICSQYYQKWTLQIVREIFSDWTQLRLFIMDHIEQTTNKSKTRIVSKEIETTRHSSFESLTAIDKNNAPKLDTVSLNDDNYNPNEDTGCCTLV
eukprot:238945_1